MAKQETEKPPVLIHDCLGVASRLGNLACTRQFLGDCEARVSEGILAPDIF